jgi:hypothetical protein
LQTLQTPVRLLPYLALVGSVAMIVALAATPVGRLRVVLTTALVLAVGAQVYMAARIAIDTTPGSGIPTTPARHADVTASGEPLAFAAQGSFAVNQFRDARSTTESLPQTTLPVTLADPLTSKTGHLSGEGTIGDRFSTTFVWSPFVRLSGDARISDHGAPGTGIVTVTRVDGDGRWSATVTSACSGLCLDQLKPSATWQVPVGRLLTLLSMLVLLALGASGLRRRRASRSAPRPAASDPVEVDDATAPVSAAP